MSVAVRLRSRRAAPTVQAAALATPAPVAYVGLVTRAIAFSVDAAIINVVAIVVTAAAALLASVLSIPDELHKLAVAAGGGLYVLWSVGYFVTFWTTTGQTPGARLMRFRVQAASGGRLLPRRALLRFLGLSVAAIPLLAGFLLILIDDRRRGLHDLLARTVVVEARDEEPAARRASPARRYAGPGTPG